MVCRVRPGGPLKQAMEINVMTVKSLTRSVVIVAVLLFFHLIRAEAQEEELRIVHVLVALCDNESQGIVPVSATLGNGDDPVNNLYWGAMYGVKTWFGKDAEWELISSVSNPRTDVLERCVFKHRRFNVCMIADGYRGSAIKQTHLDFLDEAAGANNESLVSALPQALRPGANERSLKLVVYIGHNGLMDFNIAEYPTGKTGNDRDAIILACISQKYFSDALQTGGARPLIWTSGLMAPEAYTLAAALEGWVRNESAEKIRNRAAEAYNKYQKCGLSAARRLLVSGY